jgi:hypothetical protein
VNPFFVYALYFCEFKKKKAMALFIFKSLFIFAYISSINSALITYTIDVHAIKTDEPYKAVFLEEGDELRVTCGQDNVELKEIRTFNKSDSNDTVLSNPYEITFRSVFHNGNIIVCGGKSQTTGEPMGGVVRLLTILNKPFYNTWKTCEDKDYCQNHGSCYIDPDNNATKICVCSSYFAGIKCQNMVADANTVTFLIIIGILVFIMFIAGGLAYYYRHHHKKEKKLRRLLVCSRCNKEKCESRTEDETQTSDGNIKKNNQKEYERIPQNIP